MVLMRTKKKLSSNTLSYPELCHQRCLGILLCFPVVQRMMTFMNYTVKILKFGTPQTVAIIVLKLVKFDVALH